MADSSSRVAVLSFNVNDDDLTVAHQYQHDRAPWERRSLGNAETS